MHIVFLAAQAEALCSGERPGPLEAQDLVPFMNVDGDDHFEDGHVKA